jgi:hypothetical protein
MHSTRLTLGEGWEWERTSKETNEVAEDPSKMLRVSEWVSSGAVYKLAFKPSSPPRWMQSTRRLDLPHVRGSWAAKLLCEADNTDQQVLPRFPRKELYRASEAVSSSLSRSNAILKDTIDASPRSKRQKFSLLDLDPIFD